MRLALCDDNAAELTLLTGYIESYSSYYPNAGIEYQVYSDSRVLCEDIKAGRTFDIYFLDILMPEKSGMDIGTIIRQNDSKSMLVYTTSSKEYALEAYSLHAARYLLKPISYEEFEEAMIYAVDHSVPAEERKYRLKLPTGVIEVPYSSIEYVECVQRSIEVHLIDKRILKSVTIRSSFQNEISPLLESGTFVQPHSSFAVNISCIEILTKDMILLSSGLSTPVSRRHQTEVKRQYLAYVASCYR